MKTFIFDFDGTLVDSMRQWSEKILHILDERGISYPNDFVKTITPLGDRGSAELLIKMGVNMTVEEIFVLMDSYAIGEYKYRIPAKPNVPEVLKKLKADGYSLNVLTASPHKMLDCCLQRLELYDLFDNVWSCDDFETTKADPEIYEKVAAKLNKSIDECVFLDDNFNALQTASSAGMITVGVYDDTSADYINEIKEISNAYIYNFNELLEIDFS